MRVYRTGVRWLGVTLAIAAVSGFAAGCGDDGGSECSEANCSGHGSCFVEDGAAACACDPGYAGGDCSACDGGYQDHDGDGTCGEGCATASLTCGGHGHCADSSGTAECVCDTGYTGTNCDGCPPGSQDNDDDGICLPDCDTADLDCDTGMHCDDSDGRAACVCDDGTQDHDGNGTCEPDCDAAALDCGPTGHCEDTSGTAVCTCNVGYTGDDCTECADGFQDNDDDGTCAPSCEATGLACSGHGHCDDSSGAVVCDCDDGYQDNDSDGSCLPDCATAALTCDAGLGCDDSSGTARCACADGFQDNDGDGTCLPDCATAAPDCNGHGTCDDSSGEARCACTLGWGRSDCGVCASPYYQDNDEDGTCETTCYFEGEAFTCGTNEVCSDASGVKECVCASGYQDNDDNDTCLPSCATAQADETAPLTCPDANAGCTDESGTATCVCDEGYADDATATGADCLACAAGYQDNDADGECTKNCASVVAEGLDCGTLGCDDTTGLALCNCATGSQDFDQDGVCAPDCTTAGLTCDAANHEVCSDVTGLAACVCDTGYYDGGSGTCLTVGTGGDVCADAIDIDLPVDQILADMTGMTGDFDFSCNAYGLPFNDMVYHIALAAGETWHVSFSESPVDAADAYFIPALSLLQGADCATATEVACGYGISGDGYIQFAVMDAVLDGGTAGADYYLVVGLMDYFGTGANRPVVSVQAACDAGLVYDRPADACVDNPCMPTNPCTGTNRNACVVDTSTTVPTYDCLCNVGLVEDATGTCVANPTALGEACADVIAIPVVAGEGVVTGTTDGATDDGEGSCHGDKPAPDRVYGLTLTEEMAITLTLECDDTYDCLMHARAACDDEASEVLCYDTGPEGATEITGGVLPPGSYYLFIDGWNSRPDDTLAAGAYTLTYTLYPNPCVDEAAACPGEPVCVGSADWSTFECQCEAEGKVFYAGACIDDPCDPDPCTAVPNSRCQIDLSTGAADCACDETYVDDGSGGCMVSPDAEWTIMIYWARDNNLQTQSMPYLEQWMSVAWDPHVRLLVLVDVYSGDDFIGEILPGRIKVVREFESEPDTGDWHVLRDFGVWAVTNYPAKHYMLIPDDHGGAWRGEDPPKRHLLSDDHGTADIMYVTNGDFANALEGITEAAGQKLDMIIYNACLQSEWEMAEASAPYADYMIASPSSSYGFEAGNSRVWDEWFTLVVENHETMSPRDLGETFVDYYRNDATVYQTTVALTDLGTVDRLAAAVSNFADALMAHRTETFYNQLDDIRWASQAYDYPEVVDFWDFLRRVTDMDGAPVDVILTANELIDQLDETIVYSWAYPGTSGLLYPTWGSTGLSVYLPSRYYRMDPMYDDFGAVWSHHSTWDEFVASFATGFGYCGAGDVPEIDQTGTTVDSTVGITQSWGSGEYIIQTFLAPGRELHSVRIAVRKTVADEMAHAGFTVGIFRPGVGYVWGTTQKEIEANAGEIQVICLETRGLRTTPGEELQIVLGGGQPWWDYTGRGFDTPIEWPIEYAASSDDDPPYAEGRVLVNRGDGETPIGEINGDGIPGTLWFEVY